MSNPFIPVSVMRFLIAIVLVAFSVSAHASCVILLHGLARTSGSMNKLEKALLAENYHVVNFELHWHNVVLKIGSILLHIRWAAF